MTRNGKPRAANNGTGAPRRRVDVASVRREQIVEAAAAIISDQGLQNLSLSEIEKRAGMSRGQLTYYFPTKEAILLAVFDRMLAQLCANHDCGQAPPHWWEGTRHVLTMLLTHPPVSPEFTALQYTFLAQMSHRADFRQRLATLYEGWRSHFTRELTDAPPGRPVPARAFASLVQALLHGLVMQLAADPKAFDRQEMLELCLTVLGSYLWPHGPPAPANGRARPKPPTARGKKTR
jgi:AcrR family transcriptional regulator